MMIIGFMMFVEMIIFFMMFWEGGVGRKDCMFYDVFGG